MSWGNQALSRPMLVCTDRLAHDFLSKYDCSFSPSAHAHARPESIGHQAAVFLSDPVFLGILNPLHTGAPIVWGLTPSEWGGPAVCMAEVQICCDCRNAYKHIERVF